MSTFNYILVFDSVRSPAGLTDWTFTTVRCWGESPVGKWTLIVHQDIEEISGTLTRWRLTLYGSNITADEIKDRRRYFRHNTHTRTHTPTYSPLFLRAVVDAVAGGDSIDPIICPPHPNHLNPITFPDNDKRNKASIVHNHHHHDHIMHSHHVFNEGCMYLCYNSLLYQFTIHVPSTQL